MHLDGIDKIGALLLTILFILLAYAGYLSQKSIDYDVLKRLESSKLILPTQVPTPAVTQFSPIPTK
jgi:hypothetical protein